LLDVALARLGARHLIVEANLLRSLSKLQVLIKKEVATKRSLDSPLILLINLKLLLISLQMVRLIELIILLSGRKQRRLIVVLGLQVR
jgi:hypothetical protein